MRLFLAINLPSEVRREVYTAASSLRESAPDLAWIAQSRLHLTLKFLGEQPVARVTWGVIHTAMPGLARRHREFVIVLGGVSAFPNFGRARFVWMGVAQEPRLELLHHDIEVACEQLGFELDGRPFRPHLTLARVKKPLTEERARRLRRAARSTDLCTEFIVRSIDLMQSDPSTAGPDYTTLVSAALRSG